MLKMTYQCLAFWSTCVRCKLPGALCEVAKHNFEMLAQKLKDSIKHQNDEMDRAKKAKAEADQARSTAEGELATATKMLNEGEKMLSDLQNDCMTKATEFDTEQKERGEELEALATAKSILEEKTGGAGDRTYSFLQVQASSKSKAKVRGAAAGACEGRAGVFLIVALAGECCRSLRRLLRRARTSSRSCSRSRRRTARRSWRSSRRAFATR